MTTPTPSVLFIGNFLSGLGGRRAICEELIDRLRSRQWRIASSSSKSVKVLRLADMMSTCVVRASATDVAHVDVFSGQAFFWAEAACWVLRKLGCPYILTLRGGNLPEFSRRWPGRVSALLRSAAAVTAPSGYLVDAMRAFHPDIILLPNAIDLAAYPYRVRDAAGPELVWVRSFHRIYNPVMAPHIVAGLAPQYPDIRLTMVGPDKDGSLAETKEQAERLNVSSRITFVPGVAKSEVPRHLGRGDIFLNTTNIDNMPVTIVEAMACGLPIVSTNAGGVPWLVNDGVNGILVPPRDPDRMVSAVASILADPQKARSLSLNARKDAEQFDWSRILPQWQDLFARIEAAHGG